MVTKEKYKSLKGVDFLRLEVNNLSFNYYDKNVIEDICINVKKGDFVGVIGPNGSGKSTLLKNIYRALSPNSGSVNLDGEDIYKMNFKKSASKMGVVGQENFVPFDFSVEEIVKMGRNPYKKLFDADTKEDNDIVMQSLEQIVLKHMAKTNYQRLSGGEKQRVLLARVLAQNTDFLILDEPTNHLDIYYQLQIFDLVKNLGVTVLSAIHDLNIAALYCDILYVLKNGKVVKQGTPEEILTQETIYDIYGINADVRLHPITNKIAITFLPGNLKI